MTLRKIKDTVASARASLSGQPPYHSEISDAYLDALQAEVDKAKPRGFKLTPLSEAGW